MTHVSWNSRYELNRNPGSEVILKKVRVALVLKKSPNLLLFTNVTIASRTFSSLFTITLIIYYQACFAN